jgi:MFS family permease
MYYVPVLAPSNFALIAVAAAIYGMALAGYIALPPMMTAQAPDRQGQVMSAYSLGAGASAAIGPLIGTVFIGPLGLQGVIWIYAALHLVSAALCLSIRSPGDGKPKAELASLAV